MLPHVDSLIYIHSRIVDETTPPPAQTQIPPVTWGAEFGIRAAARIIDVIYGIILGFCAGILGAIVLMILQQAGIVAPGWVDRVKGTTILQFVLGMLGSFLYHSTTEGMYGASLGKLICQLRVIGDDGQPIGMKQASIRSLAYYIDALFFGLIAYASMRKSDLNQRYGDHWAHTIVVHSGDATNIPRKSAVIFVLALLIGSTLWLLLIATGAIIHAA